MADKNNRGGWGLALLGGTIVAAIIVGNGGMPKFASVKTDTGAAQAVQAAPPAVPIIPVTGKLPCPTPGFVVTQEFGQHGVQGEPTYQGKVNFHEGIDLAGLGGEPATAGVPIHAAAAGRVTFAGLDPPTARNPNSGQGNQVRIYNGSWVFIYDHLSGFNTHPGADVKTGDVIGFVGDTGFSSASHLHFGISLNGISDMWAGQWDDPAKYLTLVFDRGSGYLKCI